MAVSQKAIDKFISRNPNYVKTTEIVGWSELGVIFIVLQDITPHAYKKTPSMMYTNRWMIILDAGYNTVFFADEQMATRVLMAV